MTRKLTFGRLLQQISKDQIDQFVNYIGTTYYQGTPHRTPLYCASTNLKQNPEAVEILLEHGANLELVTPLHGTPLIGACFFGCYDMAVLLLRK